MSQLVDAIRAFEPELIAIRRDIHRHPEVGFEETRTAALVAGRLRAWGLDVTEGIARTGTVATPKGKRAGQRTALDTLHVQEVPGRGHGSTVPSKMRACGHDGHTAMLLGAARYLAENPDFGGTVVFISNGNAGNGEVHPLHTPGYDFNDGILALGAAYWVTLVEVELGTA